MDEFENKLVSTTLAINEQSERCEQIEETLTGKVDSFLSLVMNMQSQLTSIFTQNTQKDEEIRTLKNKITALEANQDTSKVMFSGVRKNYISNDSDLTFDETTINVGQGLDPETGIFKCPVSGIYAFSFSAVAVADKERTFTIVEVYKNERRQFNIHEKSSNEHKNDHGPNVVNLAYVWTMVLQKDDRVQLKLGHGKALYYPVWFNGWLMQKSS